MPDPNARMEFVGRTLGQMCGFLLNQLPADLEVSFDMDAFLGSIEYKTSTSVERLTVSPWATAPFHVPRTFLVILLFLAVAYVYIHKLQQTALRARVFLQ